MTRQSISSAIVAIFTLSGCVALPALRNNSADPAPSEAAPPEATDVPATFKEREVAPPTTEASVATTDAVPPAAIASATTDAVPPTTAPEIPNINTDGPTVCIDAVIAHLGPDAMINEIASYFEVGDDIEPPIIEDDEPTVPGELFICTADYQDPSNPVKLLSISMDMDTGQFREPEQVEIHFTGDPTEFDLNDYVIKASEINASVIQPRMDEEAPALDETYSVWRWSRVSLYAPDAFSDVHAFDLRMEGRLAQNDLANSGYMTIALDGSVILDYLE